MTELVSPQLVAACRILFGPDVVCSCDFLLYLQLPGLKSAYRRQAKVCHPDRQHQTEGQDETAPTLTFQQLNDAYSTMRSFLDGREKRITLKPRKQTHDFQRKESFISNLQALPKRPLKFGHFLYYLGLADWQTISRILAWQRMGRPRLGEIAHQYGFLTRAEIDRILKYRKPGRPFGETARRMGLLEERQVRFLLSRQQSLQKKFGLILLERQLIKEETLDELLIRFKRHNAEVARIR